MKQVVTNAESNSTTVLVTSSLSNRGSLYHRYKRVIFPFVIVVILLMIGQILTPGFASGSHILMLLKTSAFLGMIALAQTVVILAGGEGLDLSVGALASVGAVMSSVLIQTTNSFIAFLLVALVGFLLGLVNGIGVSYFKVAPLIMTLAMASVINGLIIIYSNGFAIKGGASEWLKTVSGQSTFGVPNILLIWVAMILVSLFILFRTKTGFKLYGVGANEMTAELTGVHTQRIRAMTYGVSGIISAVSGVFLLGYIGNAFLDVGSTYVMPSIAAVVIGGVSLAGGSGNYLGVVGGTAVLTTLTGLLVNLKMGEAGKQIIFGLLLFILLTIYSRKEKT
jgi:ribose transport system permease protein